MQLEKNGKRQSLSFYWTKNVVFREREKMRACREREKAKNYTTK